MKLGLMFKLKRDNIDYIKKIIGEVANDKREVVRIINNCNDVILTDDFFHFIEENIAPNWMSFVEFCSSYKFMEMAVRNDGNNLHYARCVVDEELARLAMGNGYCMKDKTPKIIRSNKDYVRICVERYGGEQLWYATCEVDEELADLAMKKGYYMTSEPPEIISCNRDYVEKCIRRAGGEQLRYATCKVDDELANLAIEKGYKLNGTTPTVISANREKVENFIKKYGGNQLDFASCKIDDTLFDLAMEYGYQLSFLSSGLIRNNEKYVKKCIQKNGPFQLDYATCEIHSKLLDFAIDYGYQLSANSSGQISKNRDYVKKLIKIYGGNQLDYAKCTISQELLDYAIAYGFTIQVANIEKYDNVLIEKFFDSFLEGKSMAYREKIDSIKEKTNAVLVCSLKDNLLLNEEIMNEFGVELVVRCIKYLYLLGKPLDLEVLLEEKHRKCFHDIFQNILGKSLENISIEEFYDIVCNYSLYSNLLFNIMDSGVELTNEEKDKISTLFRNKDDRIQISSLSDLDNIANMVVQANKDAIKYHNIAFLKEAIYLTNFNLHSVDVSKLLNEYQINASKIKDLSLVIQDEKIKKVLNNYQVLFEMIEFIDNCQNVDILKSFLEIVNLKLSQDSNYFKDSQCLFYNLIDNIKYFYGVEVFEKMSMNTSLDNQKNSRVTYRKSVDGKKVKYLEVFEHRYYFQHALNAFGTGGTLSDFKEQRFIGKTYICLSLIDNEHNGVFRPVNNKNYVTLLFDKLSPSSLCGISNLDMNSKADDNSRALTFHSANFDTVENILKQTVSYNEYVYYRENNDGSYNYPTGILVLGKKPSQAEIDAAAYLEVPLIKLYPEKKKKQQKIEKNLKADSEDKKEDILSSLKEMRGYLETFELSSRDNLEESKVKKGR